MHRVTGDTIWMEWITKSARAIMHSGIPERETPGFWNNVSQCCGSAGVAEFMLNLHRVTGRRDYLKFAIRVMENLLTRATREGDGLKWIQAEHRVQPDLLILKTEIKEHCSIPKR